MAEVPELVAPAALAREIRTGALAAPLERMVVDELAWLAVLGGLAVQAVAHRLVDERPQHLRVAVVTTLADVDVAAVELERRVRRDRLDRRDVVADQERRQDLEQRRDDHGDRDEHAEQ